MGTRKVLLIEHDLDRRLRIGTAIVRRHWRLRTARSSAEALAVLHHYEPTSVVVDLDLLDRSPGDFLAQLRERTNGGIVGMVHRSRESAGPEVDVVVPRPFSFEVLFDAIDQAESAHAAND